MLSSVSTTRLRSQGVPLLPAWELWWRWEERVKKDQSGCSLSVLLVARQTAITVQVEGKFNIMTLEKEAGGTPDYDICIQPTVSVIRQLHICPQRNAHREDTFLSSALNLPPSRHSRNAVLQVSWRARFTGHCASREQNNECLWTPHKKGRRTTATEMAAFQLWQSRGCHAFCSLRHLHLQ